MKNIRYIYIIALTAALLTVMNSCKKEYVDGPKSELPENPFDTSGNGTGGENTITVDSNSFLGLHAYIFSPKCAVPACHDGSFEPDFRTVESAYSTLVYQNVIKNTANNYFEYRVVPGDTNKSWLHERLTTNDAVIGRMPLYDTLPPSQIKKVEEWILGGAKDIFGNSPSLPNAQPSTFGLVAYINNSNGYRVDTIRDNIVAPFIVPQNSDVEIWIGLYDDVDLPFLFGVNKIKFSTHPVDFTSASELGLQISPTPHMAPSIFGGTLPYFHHVVINTANFNLGQINYMRVYVKDLDHPNATEIPEDGSQFYLYTYFSFIVQ